MTITKWYGGNKKKWRMAVVDKEKGYFKGIISSNFKKYERAKRGLLDKAFRMNLKPYGVVFYG